MPTDVGRPAAGSLRLIGERKNMNIKVMALLTKGSKASFALACALIAGTGVAVKTGVVQIGDTYDEFSGSLNYPSPVFVLLQRHSTKPAVIPQPTHSGTLAVPANSAVPPLP
jgi:hypothetical protein